MHIIVICKALDRPESFILKGIHDLGDTVTVLCAEENAHSQMLQQAGVPVLPFPLSSRIDIRGMRRVRRFVMENSVDVVYALSNAGLAASNFGLIGLPIPLATYRGTVGHLHWYDPSSWLTFLNPRLTKIVCVSHAVEGYLHKLKLPARKLVTIYKGHDIAWYSAPPSATRADLKIPTDAFVVGCTAVMRAVKGVDILVQACQSLMSDLPHLHLLLIGSIKDPEIESLLASFPHTDRLHLTGFRADATRLATLCDVTVMASKSREGFPKSVVEAMAQGVPPIVTEVGGMPELVGHGDAGIMVPPSDVKALAEAIRALALDNGKRVRLGRAARERIETTFNIDTSISKMRSLFHELAETAARK